jgi:hypothetical protein
MDVSKKCASKQLSKTISSFKAWMYRYGYEKF